MEEMLSALNELQLRASHASQSTPHTSAWARDCDGVLHRSLDTRLIQVLYHPSYASTWKEVEVAVIVMRHAEASPLQLKDQDGYGGTYVRSASLTSG